MAVADDKRPLFELVPDNFEIDDDTLERVRQARDIWSKFDKEDLVSNEEDLKQLETAWDTIAEVSAKIIAAAPFSLYKEGRIPEGLTTDYADEIVRVFDELEPILKKEAAKEGIQFADIIGRSFEEIHDLLLGNTDHDHPLKPVFDRALAISKLPRIEQLKLDTDIIVGNKMLNRVLFVSKARQERARQAGQFISNGVPFNMVVRNASKSLPEISNNTTITVADIPKGTILDSVLTQRDVLVFNAVCTVVENYLTTDKNRQSNGSFAMTLRQISKAMPGANEKDTSHDKTLLNGIEEALEKLGRVHYTVDATNEIRLSKPDTEKAIFYGNLLHLDKLEVKANNGETTTAVIIRGTPGLYEYAKATGQLLTVPPEVFRIKHVKRSDTGGLTLANSTMKMSPTRRYILFYLTRQVERIKHDHKTRAKKNQRMRDTILIQTMFEECEIDPKTTSSKMLGDYRAFAESVLFNWKESGYISGYDIVRIDNAKRTPIAFKVTV